MGDTNKLIFTIRDWKEDTQRMLEAISNIKKQHPEAEIAVEAQFVNFGNA